jgi:hypothetical protein
MLAGGRIREESAFGGFYAQKRFVPALSVCFSAMVIMASVTSYALA